MAHRLFVFGTLKKGFPLHARGLAGLAFQGIYKTLRRFPMFVAGPRFAPMMLNEPGIGFQVHGELYHVEEPDIARLDMIESVGKPGHLRVAIEVEPVEGGPIVPAFAYMKERHLAEPAHSGFLETYNDRRFTGLPNDL
jgi:gamma-glutamylaminecyclotransferase